MPKMKKYLLPLCLVLATNAPAQTQPTVGLQSHSVESVDNGYVLFAPMAYTVTYLIDKCGKLVHSWPSKYHPFLEAYLLEDGSILRPGSAPTDPALNQMVIEKIDWNGNVVWHATVGDSSHKQHHDIQPLPNGNFLVLSTDVHDTSEAYAAGKDSSRHNPVSSEEIVEYKPVGTDGAEVVWKWRAWDHLVQDFNAALPDYLVAANHPERININYLGLVGEADWLHINSVKYNAALDQVLLSARNFCEVWIIDHSTTTQQAASHAGGRYGKGGDLLYRWGNPAAYDRGNVMDKMLFAQHEAAWIPAGYPRAGSIIIMNNGGSAVPPQHSSVDIISPPVDTQGNYDASTIPFLPLAPAWKYTGSPLSAFNCSTGGGGQMLHNGNMLICNTFTGDLFEIDSLRTKVWDYICPVGGQGPITQGSPSAGNSAYRATYYQGSDAAFAGRTLIAGAPIELNPIDYSCTLNATSVVDHRSTEIENTLFVYPNPATDHITVTNSGARGCINVYNYLGEDVLRVDNTNVLSAARLPAGVYNVVLTNAETSRSQILMVLK